MDNNGNQKIQINNQQDDNFIQLNSPLDNIFTTQIYITAK